jgi:sterol desaturase/sphingolipid hydroxylase (fatty acid hydroxylase superfamily)
VDIDLDVSTGVRFHVGGLLLSIPWRAAQIRIIGVSPLSLSIWQTMMLVAIAFHHSNIALPPAFERKLGRILVTPRMHGIHHSMVREETNSNWSSGLSIWDRMHRTMRLNIPQTELTIGLPFQRESLGLPAALKLPAMVRGTEWVLPSGRIPGRTDSTDQRTFLAE